MLFALVCGAGVEVRACRSAGLVASRLSRLPRLATISFSTDPARQHIGEERKGAGGGDMGVRSYNLIAEAMALDGSLVEVQAFLAEAMIYDASQRIGIKVEEVISTGPMIDRCGTLATGADGQEANPVAGIEVVQSPRVCETAETTTIPRLPRRIGRGWSEGEWIL
jgi:hypothetical protein